MTPSGKPLRGLFPIMETPFTKDNKLDTETLAAEVDFCNRGRLGGMIWPVFASSWSSLSDAERIEGAETILAAGKGGKSAIAIAVQNTAWDTATSVRYAKHAAEHGADAIVSMPPNNGWNVSDQAVIDYYKAVGSATDLPLIVQTRGTISVDLMIRMFEQIPTHEGDEGRGGRSAETGRRIDQADRQQTGGLGRGRRHRRAAAGGAAARASRASAPLPSMPTCCSRPWSFTGPARRRRPSTCSAACRASPRSQGRPDT